MVFMKPSTGKPWLRYYPEGADKVPLPQVTAYQGIWDASKHYMKKVALEYRNLKITYKEVFKNIDATAKAFTKQGVVAGDVVSILLPNMPETVYCMYALNKIGACANMLGFNLTTEQTIETVKSTKSKVLVIFDDFPELKKVISAVNIKIIVAPGKGWDDFIGSGADAPAIHVPFKPKTAAIMVYSSGSTGAPKAIVHGTEVLLYSTAQYKAIKLFPHRFLMHLIKFKALNMLPLFTVGGLSSINIYLTMGATAILEPEYSSDAFISHLKNKKITQALATRAFYTELVQSGVTDLSKLRALVVTGDDPEKEEQDILDYLKKCGSAAKISVPFGTSESANVAYNSRRDPKRQGAGKPLSHSIVSAFDPDTNEELGYNERGELRVATPCLMLGYFNNPKADKDFFREHDGLTWGRTGDIGYVTKEGDVFVEGRACDFVPGKNGRKVYLFDIKKVVLEDADVKSCEVIGLEVKGKTVPVVHLLLDNSCMKPHKEIIKRIHKNCTDKLSPDAVPYGYKIRESFDLLLSKKRDTQSLKKERDGYFTGGELA